MKKIIILFFFVWVLKDFGTLESVRTFLNQLSIEKARSAKVVVINSQRSFLGILSSPYQVFYEE